MGKRHNGEIYYRKDKERKKEDEDKIENAWQTIILSERERLVSLQCQIDYHI